MSTNAAPPVRRLTIALDACDCVAADVTLAIELAALIGAELHGIFVEDSDLLGLSQLPFAREVGARSGQARPMLRAAMESVLRRRVERVAGELERAGKQRNVPVSHRTARGKMVPQALEQGEHGDVVLLRPTARGRRAREARVRAGPAGPVMLWHEDGRAAAAAFEVAVQLARRSSAGLVIGFPATRFEAESDARARLPDWLLRAPVPVIIRGIAQPSARALIEAARAQRVAQLVLCGEAALASTEALERMLDELGSGVILVR